MRLRWWRRAPAPQPRWKPLACGVPVVHYDDDGRARITWVWQVIVVDRHDRGGLHRFTEARDPADARRKAVWAAEQLAVHGLPPHSIPRLFHPPSSYTVTGRTP